ncbi:type I-B CRISPR-associated endonuclease Cas1b [Peptoniphilus mikwangii]|uniref:type I-B CRISPR-associated endonuclease Cas1b n=1 Tax=Peptoniphilus mikwangii TaxID=1354300 RepID=UPI0003F7EA6C|nr:type I-B CRISPR-associated endonuclease Cas1b [Peptoniphilus mikwangii]
MGETFYLFSNGDLKRKDNNIEYSTTMGDKNLKVEMLDEIFLFGEANMNTKVLNFMAQNNVVMHIFNYYGFYSGSFFPRDKTGAGFILVNQVDYYKDGNKRLIIAQKIIDAASHNIHRNMRYYNSRNIDLSEEIKEVEYFRRTIYKTKSIQELMGLEGNIRKIYYSSWNKIFKQEIDFEKRVKHPPDNMINSLISFCNSLLYSTALSEIYKTNLSPYISYLHEPGTRRFSLSLDITEIFKPLIVDRIIFTMINRNQINEKSFDKESNFVYLKDNARKKIIQEYDERLSKTIKHKELNRSVSYRYMMRLECYKLIKHIINEKEYEGFKMWW